MAESADDILKRIKPRPRRVTESGHTVPEKPATKPATKKTAE